MRDPLEIQRAHDILAAVVLGEVPGVFPNAESHAALTAALDALCWVLQHGHEGNNNFAENLARIHRYAENQGRRLNRVD